MRQLCLCSAIRRHPHATGTFKLVASDRSWEKYPLSCDIVAVVQLYAIPNIDIDIKLVRTNLPPRTAMRAPGVLNAAMVMEEILERVASYLGKDQVHIRELNFHTGPHLPFSKQASSNEGELSSRSTFPTPLAPAYKLFIDASPYHCHICRFNTILAQASIEHEGSVIQLSDP